MLIQPVSNSQNFQGSIMVSGLNKSQEKVYNVIKDILYRKVADKDHLILNINGNPKYIERNFRNSKYITMYTQVKPETEPTAQIYIVGLNPSDWVKNAGKVINAHFNSHMYYKTTNVVPDNFWVKFKNKFYELINKGR